MKLLGKLYLSPLGRLFIHAKEDGCVYVVHEDGVWEKTPLTHIPKCSGWRLIGDSYAKD